MKRLTRLLLAFLLIPTFLEANPDPKSNAASTTSADPSFSEYFRTETAALQRACLANIHSLKDWQSNREEYRRQLQEMLGLWAMPTKTDLNPVVTGELERDAFSVEKVQFQASPHLYVTGNLYLPKNSSKPAPAILYVCGHSRVVTNGVSCGNKVGYLPKEHANPVPEGHATIAQRFNVGVDAPYPASPEGTAEAASHLDRSFGTCPLQTLGPNFAKNCTSRHARWRSPLTGFAVPRACGLLQTVYPSG